METETPLLAEAIAITEKKVAMALDDIIKLSKNKTYVNKGKKLRRQKKTSQNFNAAARNNTSSHHMNSLSTVRQGAVAKRRTKFHGNQFPVTTNIARRPRAPAPLSVLGRAFNAGRMTSDTQSRIISPPVQNFSVLTKSHEVVLQNVGYKGGEKKTLDSRFASMKEQRKSNNNNNKRVGVQVRKLPPWARARMFPN